MGKIVHIIQHFCRAGADRAMLALAKYSARLGNWQHQIVSLVPAQIEAIALARQAEIEVVSAPSRRELDERMTQSDIVHVHFWNNPELYQLFQSDLPSCRLLLWIHTAGDSLPQIITRDLIDYADFVVTSSAYSYELPVFQTLPDGIRQLKTTNIYSGADYDRLVGILPKSHSTFNIGYLGTVDFAKMHPNYISMSSSIDIPDVKFIVVGTGRAHKIIERQAAKLGIGICNRFQIQTFVEDIRSFFEILDVFGYPLCENNYSTAELVLQEAMYAGVPPVIFAYGGAQKTVIDNETGLIVNNEGEYKEAIEYLYNYPQERQRLSENCKKYARDRFGAENTAKQFNQLYDRLLKFPKRSRGALFPHSTPLSGAELFCHSIGEAGRDFITSMELTNIEEMLTVENRIAALPEAGSDSGGGLLHYRNAYKSDPYLRLWSGLILQYRGQNTKAIFEFQQAIKLGLSHWRVYWYLARSTVKIGAFPWAKKALRKVIELEPNFKEAKQMLHCIEDKSDFNI